MEEKQIVQHLLTQVSIINKKYDDIAAITGERFNIFEILGLSSNENRTHSAFLKEMLDPNGKHGLGSAFLQLFLKQINWEEPFIAEGATVIPEFPIGLIPADYSEGGRIDIIIENKEKTKIVLIENKIYAIDQKRQLERYYRFGIKKGYNNFKLLYLNLDGSEPSKESFGKLTVEQKTKIQIISYQEHIKNWLEECKSLSADYPLLRETIKQYIHLIKNLTNQSINNKMSNEILKTITSDEKTFFAACEIPKVINQIRLEIHSKIISHFNSYFNRIQSIEPLLNSMCSLKIQLASDIKDHYYVGVSRTDKTAIIEVDYWEKLQEMGKQIGGSGNNEVWATYYKIQSVKYRATDYSDAEIFKYLNEENLNKLFEEIDSDIEQFIRNFANRFRELDNK